MKGDDLPQRASGLLTLTEAADYLGIAVTTLKDWLYRRRAIPWVSVGHGQRGRPMVYKRDLDKFLDSRKVPALDVIDGTPKER